MGIESGSAEAMSVVPVLTFWVAVWLLVFSLLGAGKLVNYISAPVMGGFITGICTTIILMQAPKLLGGSAGTGELPELLLHLWESLPGLNVPSLLLGLLALCILLLSKKIMPKFPMAVVLMALARMEPARSFRSAFCGCHDHQFIGCCRYHGRDPFGRKFFCRKERLPD